MKISLGAIVFCISLAFLTDIIFEKYIVYSNDHSNAGKINRLLQSDDKTEIPIFGSSIARNNYYPDSIDHNVFNYGMKGAIFEVVEPLMKIEFGKDKSTPIIYNFHHLTFLSSPGSSIQLSNFVPFIENENIKDLLQKNGLYKDYMKVRGLRFYGCYTDYIKEHLRPYLDKNETISKGAVHTNAPDKATFDQHIRKRQIMIDDKFALIEKRRTSPAIFTKEDSLKLSRLESLLLFKPKKTEVDRFENLISQNKNRTVILIYTPQHRSKLKGIENIEELNTFLADLEGRHDNLKILNYSNIDLPDEYFKDTGHLSLKGAQKFSGILNDDLNTLLNDGHVNQ
ncbi:MAG: hypothetical protein HKN39_04965 [Flavobacteriales bacterium]|nr:hypothetical protein [Flavobacteriales bacterium]